MPKRFLIFSYWVLVGIFLLPSSVLAQTHSLAIVDASTDTRTPGRFVWADLVSDEAAKAVEFYQGLLGWSIQKVGENYYVASNNGVRVAGIAQHNGEAGDGSTTQWVSYISSTDIDNVIRHAIRNGGEIVKEAQMLEGRGEYALLSDPEGAMFGVLRSEYGDPVDHVSEYGEWVWQELWASNPIELAEFYVGLGYTILENWQTEEVGDDIVLEAGGFARGSIVSKIDVEQPSAWLPYLRVSNVEDSIARTQELGGQVIMNSADLSSSYPVAVIVDPSGGVVALIEWTPEEGVEQ